VEKGGRNKQATDDNIRRRMRLTYWITNATDTYSEFVILTVFPRQQRFHEGDSVLNYTCIA